MGLSDNLLSQFAKLTVGDKKTRSESTVMGTVKEYADSKYVQIDGSELLTPVASTTDAVAGDRVTILIKDHTATITGNITSPSARLEHVKQIEADVGTLVAENVIITGKLTAYEAEIGTLKANDVTITGTLNAAIADIGLLSADNVTIKGTLTAAVADIGTLKTDKLSAKDAEIQYAQIDFANIGKAAVEKLFAESGIIRDLVMKDGVITGELTSVTINGDLINANTLKADRLVIKGKDGLYYQLNVNGVKEGEVDENGIEIEQTNENSLDGTYIMAKSVTASKIDVSDLVAFNATIGGFQIGDASIYSGKPSVDSGTRGIYMDKIGQLALGDSNDYIKYYQDAETGEWKLKMKASEFSFALSNGESVDDAIAKTLVLTEEEFYQSDSPTSLTGGSWSKDQPTWTEGKYIWRRTKNTYNKKDENGNPVSDYTPSEDGVCITGNTGSQGPRGEQGLQGETGQQGPQGETGEQGPQGNPGDPGKGIKSITKYYCVCDSPSTPTTSWSTDVLITSETNRYLWSYEITEYTDGSKDYTVPIVIGTHGETGATGEQGPQGEKGETGEQGPQGEKGETGASGKDGKSVSSVDVKYYLSSSSTALSGGSWSTDAPTWVNGKYMWSKTAITYSDNTMSESAPVCITGAKGSTGAAGSNGANGADGADGKGVSSIVEQYYQSTSNTTQTGGSWSTNVPTWVDGKYIWTRSVITYTDNTTTTTTPVCVTGGKGATGATGKGIKSIAEKYAVSSSSSTAPSTWYDSMQTMTTTNKYLWNYEIITYTDNTTSETTKRVIGVYGNTGGTGAAGKGISSITNYYLVSSASSGVTTSTSGWSTSIKTTTTTNKYLWNYEVITYTNGTTTTTTPVIIGTHGATGSKGDKGDKGDTGATGPQGPQGNKGDTGATGPQGPQGDKGDKGDTGATGPQGPQGATGAAGKDGQMLYATCSTGASTAAKVATLSTGSISSLTAGVSVTVKFAYANTTAAPTLNVSSKGAKTIKVNNVTPSSTNPYYWKAGTVITFVYDGSYWVVVDTSVTKFDLVDAGFVVGNYNSSGALANNVLIGASTVDIRNGSTVYASYGANLIELGKNSTSSVINLCADSATMKLNTNDYDVATFEIKSPDGRLALASRQRTLIESIDGDGASRDNTAKISVEAIRSNPSEISLETTTMYWSALDGYPSNSKATNSVTINNKGVTLEHTAYDESVSLQLLENQVSITGSLSLGTPLSTSYGGTGATDIATARTNLAVWCYDTTVVDSTGSAYPGLAKPNSQTNNWIRTGQNGLLPYKSGGGSSSLGTYQWPFTNLYAQKLGYPSNSKASIEMVLGSTDTTNTYFRPSETTQAYYLGSDNRRWTRIYSVNALNTSSDRRVKTDISPLGANSIATYGLRSSDDIHSELFDRLKPVQYKMINSDDRLHYGLVAQDVVEAMTELGIEEDELDLIHHDCETDPVTGEETENYSMVYNNFIAMLIHEVQKLKSRIDELENS